MGHLDAGLKITVDLRKLVPTGEGTRGEFLTGSLNSQPIGIDGLTVLDLDRADAVFHDDIFRRKSLQFIIDDIVIGIAGSPDGGIEFVSVKLVIHGYFPVAGRRAG